MPAHDFQRENLGRGTTHGGQVERSLANGCGDVFCYGAEPRTAVGDRQVVVYCLGNTHAHNRIANCRAHLADLVGRVLRVSTAVVEKESNVMSFENLDQALVLRPVLLNRSELVPTGPERSTWRMSERSDRGFGVQTRIDQIFSQRADDAVAAGIHLTNLLRTLARSLQHAAGRGV